MDLSTPLTKPLQGALISPLRSMFRSSCRRSSYSRCLRDQSSRLVAPVSFRVTSTKSFRTSAPGFIFMESTIPSEERTVQGLFTRRAPPPSSVPFRSYTATRSPISGPSSVRVTLRIPLAEEATLPGYSFPSAYFTVTASPVRRAESQATSAHMRPSSERTPRDPRSMITLRTSSPFAAYTALTLPSATHLMDRVFPDLDSSFRFFSSVSRLLRTLAIAASTVRLSTSATGWPASTFSPLLTR